MPSVCEICRTDLSAHGVHKLPGRRCCAPCAAALFDMAVLIRRQPVAYSDPLQTLRAEISALADKASASAGARMDYDRGRADAHNYDHCLVLCAIAKSEKPEGVTA